MSAHACLGSPRTLRRGAGPPATALVRRTVLPAGRVRRAVLLATAVLAAGCGEPLAVVGDIPGIMRVVAGVPESTGNTNEERATESRLDDPVGLAVGEDGVLYLADRGNARVLSVNSAGRLGVVLDHSRCSGTSCLERPAYVALDGDGGIVVTDPGSDRLWRIELAGGAPSVLAGTGQRGSSPDGVPAAGSPLSEPQGVAVVPDGAVLFAERSAHRIRAIRPDGTLTTVAGTGEAGFAGDGGAATAARLNAPTGLSLAGGRLYVADSGNDRVRVVDLASGAIATVAGSGLRGFAGDGDAATAAALHFPEGVAATPDGEALYVADTRNHRVRLVRLEAGTISTFAGNGDPAFTGEFRDAGATGLRLPAGAVASGFGLVWIADTGHEVVWRVAVEF